MESFGSCSDVPTMIFRASSFCHLSFGSNFTINDFVSSIPESVSSKHILHFLFGKELIYLSHYRQLLAIPLTIYCRYNA